MDQSQIMAQEDERQRLLQKRLTSMGCKAWFQRPPDNKMSYPCFLYRPSRPFVKNANDKPYIYIPCWNVIYISKEPDLGIVRRMLEEFSNCGCDREYENDNLYHYSFTLYF